MPIGAVERAAPILLHGPVGAAWLEADGSVEDRDAPGRRALAYDGES